MGLAPIMGWTKIPDPRDHAAVRAFVRAHRKSVQRWLDWLAAAGLVTHIPQQDAEGFWWRTIITLHPCPELPAQTLADAAERRAGWGAREARRRARGRKRDLTSILQAARLTAAQRRSRAIARRAELARYAERQRVRQTILESLKTHLTHPCGASATPQYQATISSSEDEPDRGITRANASAWDLLRPEDDTAKSRNEEKAQTGRSAHPDSLLDPDVASDPGQRGGGPQKTGDGGDRVGGTRDGERGLEGVRDGVYREVVARRWYGDQPPPRTLQERREVMAAADGRWAAAVKRQERRLAELAAWGEGQPAPERWRLLEAWAVAAHGEQMTAAGAFRLAFYSEQRPNHGQRLDRALARYERHAELARPAGWPRSPTAALARWITSEVVRQDGPEHGIALDIARFDRFTKQMAAYAHYQNPEHLQRAARRAQRRAQLQVLAARINERLPFRTEASPTARITVARALLDSPHPNHTQAGSALYAQAQTEERLAERDQRLSSGRHPGLSDGRYTAACTHAERWGLPAPAAGEMRGSHDDR
jgi:hypothetical protein